MYSLSIVCLRLRGDPNVVLLLFIIVYGCLGASFTRPNLSLCACVVIEVLFYCCLLLFSVVWLFLDVLDLVSACVHVVIQVLF